MVNKNSVLYKKVLGCIIGGAIGDAFGGPIEGMDKDFIRQLHGGPVTDLIDYTSRPKDFFQPAEHGAYAWSTKAGTHTDDTYFAVINARCIVEKGGRINCDDIADYWLRNLDIDRGWHSVRASYWNMMMTGRVAREASKGNIGDNSSPMCIGPVGIINACDPAQAALDGYDVATIIHDDHSREAAGLLAAAVAEAMNPQSTIESIAQAALNHIPGGRQSRMYEPTKLAIQLARKARDTEELTNLYYDQLNVDWKCRSRTVLVDGRHNDSVEALESVPCAVGMFIQTKGDFNQTIIGAANYGRDCDTIACMAGYIAGAYNGADKIPQKWIDACVKANPDAQFLKLAEQMTETVLSQNEKISSRCTIIDSMK